MFGQSIFNYKAVNRDKLAACGFECSDGVWTYSEPVVEGQFQLVVRIEADGEVTTAVYDRDSGEEYILHQTSATGAFVGRVRSECEEILQRIADRCFEPKVFRSANALAVIDYIRAKYQNEFEFLWEKFAGNAIVRRQDNQKWYALLLKVKRNIIGLPGDELIEIMDLRMKPEEIESLVDGKKYFPGYHMNKRHWVTICLDDSIPLEEIFMRIDESYLLAQKR